MIWPFRRRRPESAPAAPRVDVAAIARRARRLRFRVKPTAVSVLSGAYLGARPGLGLTFAELRAYGPGDDVRHLDWNATARQGRPYVRRFVEERSLTLWLIVDVSASLRFGPDGQSKADRAAQAAALLATAAVRSGDRVALTLVSDRIEAELRPGGGERHLERLIRALVATSPTSSATDLSMGLTHISRASRRALVVVMSDFLSDRPLPVASWRRAARRHEVIALRVIDPREEALPPAGLLALRDAETGMYRTVDAGPRRVRERFTAAASSRRDQFRRWCSETGISGDDVPTSVDPLVPLVRIFSRRARMARRGTM